MPKSKSLNTCNVMELIYPPPTAAAGGLTAANNLSDVASAGSARANLEVISERETNERLAAKSPSAYVQSDGATTNRASSIAVPGARGNLAAFPGPVTAWALVDVPTANPPTNQDAYLFSVSSGAAAFPWTFANSLYARIFSTDILEIVALGATISPSDSRRYEYAGFRAAYSGRRVLLEIAWPQGDSTTNPVIYADGVDITSNFTLTTAGTPPNWLDANLVSTFHLTGFNWPAGRSPLGAFGFGAFTAAERAEFVRTGLPPAWWMRGGSAVALNTNTFTSAGAETFTGAAIGGFDQAVNTTGDMLVWARNTRNVLAGQRYWAKYTATNNAGTLPLLSLRVPGGAAASAEVQVVAGANYIEILTTATVSGIAPVFRTPSAVAADYAISGFEWGVLGAITHPAPLRDTLIVADATDIGNVPGRIVGGNVVSADAPQTIPLSLDFNYTGSSINLLGGVILPAGTIWEVVSVTGESNASVNLSLGTSTGGTQIVNAQAVTAAPFRIGTFASQLINATAATGLWLTGSGNVAGRINVQLRKVK
jgi:hypothetical protein